MPDAISQMTPLLPERADDLQDLALEVIQRSASLGTRQHPITLRTLRELLRIINSYYSNLIEGHNTHPYPIFNSWLLFSAIIPVFPGKKANKISIRLSEIDL
jgi:hypothetical protein